MDHTKPGLGQLRPMRPTIIIGLGGTGQRIALEIRRRIVQEYGDLDMLPIVGFFVIDTDIEKPIIPGLDDATLRKIQLDPSEFFHAKVTGTEKLKSELRSYPHLAEWVDKAILERGDISVGAKGIRAIGRLAYFLNYGSIKNLFNAVRAKVTDQPNLRFMADNHMAQVATGLNVFIITSICGGTGSGMFLDLAFTIKEILKGTEHNRIGYMVLPGVFGTDMAKAAGYAALRELNHYQMDHEFEVNWENEPKPKSIQPPPFDFCYLVNNTNGKVNFQQKEHLFEMVAHNIFLEFAHEFGQYKASLKDNLQASAVATDKLGCPLNYISLGLSAISFPKERIINACSYKLAREIVDRWTTGSDETAKVDEYVDHFLDYNKLFIDVDAAKKNQIKDELVKIAGGGNYYSRVDDEMTAILNGIKSQDISKYDVLIDRREEEIERKFYDGDRDPARWGEYFRGIYKNSETKKKEVAGLIISSVSDILKKENEGFEYAKAFLETLERRFIHYRDYSRNKFGELSKAESSFSRAKIDEYEKLKTQKSKFSFDRKKAMLEQVDKLVNTRTGKLTIYFKRKIDKKILELTISTLSDLAEYCKGLILEIDKFREKLSRVRKSLADAERTLSADTSGLDVYSLTLHEIGDVDRYYQEFVSKRDRDLGRDCIVMIGDAAISSLEAGALFNLRKDEFTERQIREALVKESRPAFEPINDLSVARKFMEKYPTESEQMMHLRNVFTSSEVFLNFRHVPDFTKLPNSKVSLIGVYEGRQPSLIEFKELLPLLERSCTESDQLKGIQPIRRKDEILFTTEEGAFPLRMINEIDDYEAKYDKLSQGYQNPLHLRKDDRDFLVEIIQPTESEQRKAKIGIYVGIAIGLIKPDADDTECMIYNYRDPRTGFVESKPMGKSGDEEKMIDTLLHRFNKDLREIIYADVDSKLRSVSGSLAGRETMWKAIDNFRTNYMKRRDREFIQKRGIPELFKEVIEEYRLFDPSFVTA